MINFFDKLNGALQTSYIDKDYGSTENLRAKLIYNDVKKGSTVLSKIQYELEHCDSFWFSVAFITDSGLVTLKNQLRILEQKNIKGKILTTDYLNFSSPRAMRELLKFRNIEVRVSEEKFHTKGYMFYDGDMRRFMIGSSNMTQYALKQNKEWNLFVTSSEDGEVIGNVEQEFNHMWENSKILDFDWISRYEEVYKESREVRKKGKVDRLKTYTLEPNKMQIEALSSLDKLRKQGKKKALLISATGTGKTYLSAFDVRKFNAKKVLFLAHREKILSQAESSFKDVLGHEINSGILSGTSKKYDVDYMFSTVNMMSKDETLSRFKRDEFDYIIVDETHRAVAKTYRKVIEYFSPEFILGMTATPERLDEGNVFELYDYNIAYEIRLNQALEEEILCPFHYFGISEMRVNNEIIDNNTEFRYLVSDQRVNHITEMIDYYGHSGDRPRGLIFCSTNKEASELSQKFNEKGYRTIALSGKNSTEERDIAIERLESDSEDTYLDYIFSVDIMNEGVDIPSLNQIIMLRPTESAIVFVQQLGRGLRKYDDKDYVVVLDFIGNYDNNYMIPVALFGDRTYIKDNLRRYVAEGNRTIPGVSTINFDEISKQKIYDSLDSAKFNSVQFLRNQYGTLKEKIGKIPNVLDFKKYGDIDAMKFIEKFKSYHYFLKKYEEEYELVFSDIEEKYIEYISRKIANGKRIHEVLILEMALEDFNNFKEYGNNKADEFSKRFKSGLDSKYGIILTDEAEKSVVRVLKNEFLDAQQKKVFGDISFLDGNYSAYYPSKEFLKLLNNPEFYITVMNLVDFSKDRYKELYSERNEEENFSLYQSYSYEDVCRLLNWDKNYNGGMIGGYWYDEKTNTFPIFINYEKSEDCIAYEDRFMSRDNLIAISKKPRGKDSNDAKIIFGIEEFKERPKMSLFVRKNKDDKESSKDFYYLGNVIPMNSLEETNEIEVDGKKAFEINYKLEASVREDIYDYITEVSLDG